jgi:mRNA-degrading endonuclease toxin of MazEF toxin-antitoxin module
MKRGDVVLFDYPFSDATGSKLRPALVVQADHLNNSIDDTILALITRACRVIPSSFPRFLTRHLVIPPPRTRAE